MFFLVSPVIFEHSLANCFAADDCIQSFCDSSKWFSNPVAGFCSAIISPEEIVLFQKGALTHKNKWKIDKLSFDIQFDKLIETNGQYLFAIQFAKKRRSSFYGEPHNRGSVNNSYGVVFTKDGQVLLSRFGSADEVEIIGKSPIVIDPLKTNSIELEFSRTENTFNLKLKVNDGNPVAIKDVPEHAESFNDAGYITFLNLPIGLKTHLTDIDICAEEFSADESAVPNPIYLLEYFNNETDRFIHWRYNERTQDYAGVNIYCQDKLLASLKYPADRFVIPDGTVAEELVVKAVDIDGDESRGSEIKLESDKESLLEKDIQRITVSPQEPYAQLIKKRTKDIFNVRGVNYVRLTFGEHSTFMAENHYLPDLYDTYDSEAMFRVLKRCDYNTVRVFLTGRSISNPGIAGYPQFDGPVYNPYLDNLIDFLRLAKQYGIYVLPTFGDGEFPYNEYYRPIHEKLVRQVGEKAEMEKSHNFIYLLPDGIEARKTMFVETLNYIKKADPSLLDIILSIQCQNELSIGSDQWPFNLTKGKIQTANGKVYDMADADSRQRCMDEGLNHYHRTLTKAIKEVDPELLVAEGAFTLRIVGKDPVKNKGVYKLDSSDARFPPTAVVMANSGLDIIDIHIYHVFEDDKPADGYHKDMNSMSLYGPEMSKLRTKVPVIMGEFGAFKFMNETFSEAKSNILATRNACLKEGLNGFMIWTFDTFEQQELYHALDGGVEFLSELNGRWAD